MNRKGVALGRQRQREIILIIKKRLVFSKDVVQLTTTLLNGSTLTDAKTVSLARTHGFEAETKRRRRLVVLLCNRRAREPSVYRLVERARTKPFNSEKV